MKKPWYIISGFGISGNLSTIRYLLKKYNAFIREKYTLHSDVFDEELYKKTLEGDFERRLEIETEKREMQVSSDNNNQPQCPICKSTKIHKISGANKVGSALMFGVFAAGHVSKTFKCDSCGAKF